jgi:hypothetical protein
MRSSIMIFSLRVMDAPREATLVRPRPGVDPRLHV